MSSERLEYERQEGREGALSFLGLAASGSAAWRINELEIILFTHSPTF